MLMANPYPLIVTPPAAEAVGWSEPYIPHGPPSARLARPGGWLRFEIGWLQPDQAVKNLETVVSLLQSGGHTLEECSRLISQCLMEVNGAWAGGDRTRPPPGTLAAFVRARLRQVDELVRQSRFHGRGLLDGQSGVAGLGMGVVFIRGGPNTASSPAEGFEVRILGFPSRASITGGVTLHEDWLRAEREIFLAEGENYIRY